MFRCKEVLSAIGALTILLASGSQLLAQPNQNPGNLPIFTSPIDITGLKLVLRASAPHRENGHPVDVQLPPGVLPPSLSQLLSVPLSTQLDQYWNSTRDPATGKTAQQAACDGPNGIRDNVAKQVQQIGPGFSAYDITCDLVPTGRLLAKQVGSTVTLAYLLTSNTVSFASTSPGTCRAGHGTPFCPNDPRFVVRFATEITTSIRFAGLCQIFGESGTVFVVGASIEGQNAAADVGRFFAGQKFVAAEQGITNTVRAQPLPIDGVFNDLRTSDACTGRIPGVSRVLKAFQDTEIEINLRDGLILKATYAGLSPPSLDAPNSNGPSASNVPSFSGPAISTAAPEVTAGNPVQVTGQHFPPNSNFANTLPVSVQHGPVGDGLCIGGSTSMEWGPVVSSVRVQQLPSDAQGKCATAFDPGVLTPGTAYQFRARDCDLITCSLWSKSIKATTDNADPNVGQVNLLLDGGPALGVVTADSRGAFTTSVTIPPGTSPGTHVIRAVGKNVNVNATIQIKPPAPAGGGTGSIMMVGLLPGETGCPNHMLTSTQTDDDFLLFGSGFVPGTVEVHLDDASGPTLGVAPVRPDGSICQRMRSPAADKAGPHSLVAMQNGAVSARRAVTFVLPTIIH